MSRWQVVENFFEFGVFPEDGLMEQLYEAGGIYIEIT